jgi:hypothetical protein
MAKREALPFASAYKRTGQVGRADRNQMNRNHTSTQPRRAAVDLQQRRRMPAPSSCLLDVGSGGVPGEATSAPHIVNETKLSIVTVMRALERATTPEELRMIWGRCRPLSVFDYHLCTLVRAGVAELVIDGPKLRFRLVGGSNLVVQSTRLQGAVP